MVSPKIGFLFPGQGAQYVGMGHEAAEKFDGARQLFQQADGLLGYPLSQICFQGPEDALTRTLHAQPAIFVTSLALLSVLEEKRPEIRPDFVAGLSLGEFSALAAIGSLSFAEGLKLVRVRAQSMEKAASETEGAMVSILGLAQEDCTAIAQESGAELANLNAPDQFVLSGSKPSIEKAADLAEKKGAKRIVRLKVGGAFHSSLMEPARKKFGVALKNVSIRAPQCHFIPNVSAREESNPEEIRSFLAEQLTHPVRWIETMFCAREKGVRRFIEIGPGRVLKGLAKRIDPSLEVFSLEKVSDLEALESALEKV